MSNKCLSFKKLTKLLIVTLTHTLVRDKLYLQKGVINMLRILKEYKGVILFFLVLLVMSSLWSNNVKKLNELETNNTVNYYEK